MVVSGKTRPSGDTQTKPNKETYKQGTLVVFVGEFVPFLMSLVGTSAKNAMNHCGVQQHSMITDPFSVQIVMNGAALMCHKRQ